MLCCIQEGTLEVIASGSGLPVIDLSQVGMTLLCPTPQVAAVRLALLNCAVPTIYYLHRTYRLQLLQLLFSELG